MAYSPDYVAFRLPGPNVPGPRGQISRTIALWWQLRYNKKAGLIRLF